MGGLNFTEMMMDWYKQDIESTPKDGRYVHQAETVSDPKYNHLKNDYFVLSMSEDDIFNDWWNGKEGNDKEGFQIDARLIAILANHRATLKDTRLESYVSYQRMKKLIQTKMALKNKILMHCSCSKDNTIMR